MSSCLQAVRPMLSFSLFSCVYFRFRTRFSNRLNTWQATATATKHTHTLLIVCVCVSHSHMAPAGTVDRIPFWPSNSKRCGVNRNHLQLHRPLPVEITRLSSSSFSFSSPSLSLSFCSNSCRPFTSFYFWSYLINILFCFYFRFFRFSFLVFSSFYFGWHPFCLVLSVLHLFTHQFVALIYVAGVGKVRQKQNNNYLPTNADSWMPFQRTRR